MARMRPAAKTRSEKAGERSRGSSWAPSTSAGSRRLETGAPGRRRRRGRPGPQQGTIAIELTDAQIALVVREAMGGGRPFPTLSRGLRSDGAVSAYHALQADPQLSCSLIAGMLVLAAVPEDRSYISIAEIARQTEMNSSTTHRYVKTLLALGLLDQNPATRKYRLSGSL
jgi:IclR helix-turn-helix domain